MRIPMEKNKREIQRRNTKDNKTGEIQMRNQKDRTPGKI